MVMRHVLRWLPLICIIIIIGLFFYFGLHRYFTFAALAQHEKQLEIWTQQHYFWLVLVYIVTYILIIAISVPGAVFLTLLGGFLFGVFPGVLYVIFSATIGACLLFLAVRTSLGNYLAQKASGWVRKLEVGFQKNAWNYLLFLRLVPVFPFWVVNIIPALLNVPLSVFASATVLGIIPGSLVYVFLGRDLDVILSTGQAPNLKIIFEPAILLPIIFLAILSLVPVLYKKYRHHD